MGGEEKEMSERVWGLRENMRLHRKVGEDEPPHPRGRSLAPAFLLRRIRRVQQRCPHPAAR